MGANRHSMKDVPLYKEGDDPIVFVTSFVPYLNYYDIDPMTKILKAGDVGFVSVADSNKEIKKHYTDPETLLGRALQGQASSWYLDNVQGRTITSLIHP